MVEAAQDRLHGEVVFTQPVSTKLFAGALFAILLIAGVWLSIGTYARVETVPGMLVTDTPSTKIVARQAGTVATLAVREGDLVKKGDRLLIINSDREAAQGGDVAARGIDALRTRQQISEAQVAMAQSRAIAERARLSSAMSSAEAQAASLEEQITLQRAVVASNQEIFDRIEKVVEQGFVSRVEYERRKQTLL